jgi:reactive intermediate/imine deaminase
MPGAAAFAPAKLLIRQGGSMGRQVIQSTGAPAAIGPYSQAVRAGDTLYMSGQIPLDPQTMQIVDGGIDAQARQVFANLRAVAAAAGATLNDIVKLTILMTDLSEFAQVNDIMAAHFDAPYPARATYQVAALPRGARIEVEAVLVLRST